MDTIEYVKQKIKNINNIIPKLVDHDEIMRLKQKKVAYEIYIEVMEYRMKYSNKKSKEDVSDEICDGQISIYDI